MSQQSTQTLKNNLAEATQDASQVTEKAGEVVKDVAVKTGETLEKTTNKTLDFLGIPVDVDAIIANGIDLGIKVALALLVFFVGKWIGKRVIAIAKQVMSRSQMDATTANFLGNVLYGLMLVAVTLAALNKLGVNTNSFVAILGGAAVAIGVSLKDQLGNLAAGVMIVIFRPFSRGDYVEVGGKVGTIMDITLVNTRIRTVNNHEIIIPNGDIMTSASINYSSLPQRRVEVVVGIGYDSDIETARSLMLKEAKNHESVLHVPEPVVRVTGLGDNAVQLTLYVWSENSDWFFVQCDLLESIKYSFDKHGVELPYPQRSVHLDSEVIEVIKALKPMQEPNKVSH